MNFNENGGGGSKQQSYITSPTNQKSGGYDDTNDFYESLNYAKATG